MHDEQTNPLERVDSPIAMHRRWWFRLPLMLLTAVPCLYVSFGWFDTAGFARELKRYYPQEKTMQTHVDADVAHWEESAVCTYSFAAFGWTAYALYCRSTAPRRRPS
jgi:hypothetical protein